MPMAMRMRMENILAVVSRRVSMCRMECFLGLNWLGEAPSVFTCGWVSWMRSVCVSTVVRRNGCPAGGPILQPAVWEFAKHHKANC